MLCRVKLRVLCRVKLGILNQNPPFRSAKDLHVGAASERRKENRKNNAKNHASNVGTSFHGALRTVNVQHGQWKSACEHH